jgi:hypothetical protein
VVLLQKIKNGLKRFVSILFIAIATLALFVFAVAPHHHHQGALCFVMERCEQDGYFNDEHTQHHGDADDINHHDHCIMETGYVLYLTENEVKYKISSCDNSHSYTHFFPILCISTAFLAHDTEPQIIKHEYREFFYFYKSIDVSRNNGLRAPPSFL